MDVILSGKKVTLHPRDQVGSGGEAVVYRHQSRAVKVYHPLAPGLSAAERQQAVALLQQKVAKLRAWPTGLPSSVVSPEELATDARSGEVVGYAMPLLSGVENLRKLSSRKYREAYVDNQATTALMMKLHEALSALHRRGVTVGDLNDHNVLFRSPDVFLIDADSMQFSGFPCMVAHELFLDPRFYGVDLSQTRCLSPETDWYAFAVMLTSSLLYVHPYGGIHPKYGTLLQRAAARVSILRPDVTWPKGGAHFKILPDELLHHLEALFERDRRGDFPPRLLELPWKKCICGLEHARPTCPDCAQPMSPSVAQAHRYQGRCEAATVVRTSGQVIRAVVQGTLRYVLMEGGEIRREDGSKVLTGASSPDMQFAISGDATWVGHQDRVVCVLHEQVLERAACGQWEGEPMFDANSAGCYRLEGDYLIRGASLTRMGQILEGQTFVRVGEHLGFGFYRAGAVTHYFVFDAHRPGLRQVALPPLRGRLRDVYVAFDVKRVLFQAATEEGGRVTHRVHVLDERGQELASESGFSGESPALSHLEGRAIVGDRIVGTTDQGLESLRVDRNVKRLTDAQRFSDTEPFVRAGAEVLPGPGGTVYLVTQKAITHLKLLP